MGLAENIKKFRTAYHMDQKELGKALNVSDKTISSWECGRTEPKIGMIQSMADIFGVDKTDIINGRIYETFDNQNDFELAWHRSGGGRHPIELSDLEHEIVLAYRCADTGTQNNICKLLDIDPRKNDSNSLREA